MADSNNIESLFRLLIGRGQQNQGNTPGYYFTDFSSGTRSGISVDADFVLENPTVMACVDVIANNYAQLDWAITRRDTKGFQPVQHQNSDVLLKPNSQFTAYELRHAIAVDLLTHGNAFLYLIRDRTGRVVEMIPMDPEYVSLGKNAAGRITYTNIEGGTEKNQIPTRNIIHFRDFATHRATGLSRVVQCAELVALDFAVDYLAADMFANGNALSGVIESTTTLPQEHKEALGNAWKAKFAGNGQSRDKGVAKARGGVAILDEGLIFKEAKLLTPADADLVNYKKQLMTRIAAVMHVPASYLEIADNNKYNNVSQKQTGFYRDTMNPFIVNTSQKLTAALTPEPNLEVSFDIQDLLKGDFANQMNIMTQGVSNGLLTPNEARDFLGYEKSDQEGADELAVATAPEMEAEVEPEGDDNAEQ